MPWSTKSSAGGTENEEMAEAPRYCRTAAYEFFSEQLPALEETDALVRAAVAVSMHELDDVDPAVVEMTLTKLASEINNRVWSGNTQALAQFLICISQRGTMACLLWGSHITQASVRRGGA